MAESAAPQAEDKERAGWNKKSGASTGAWGAGAWSRGSSAPAAAPAPVAEPSASTRPDVEPQGKGFLHALSSNTSKLLRGEERHHSGDNLSAPFKKLGQAVGFIDSDQDTADRRAKQARGAHLAEIRTAGTASAEHQAGLEHSGSSPLAEVTKQEYRDDHRAPKTAAVDPDHASMNALFAEKKSKTQAVDPDHESMNALFAEKASSAPAGVDAKPKSLHGVDKLNDIFEKRRLAGGSTTSSQVGVEMMHGGERAFEANSSTEASAAHTVAKHVTGVNAQELTGHAINASRLLGGSLAAADPQKQANAKVSEAIFGVRQQSMHDAQSEWKDLHKPGVDSNDPAVKEQRKWAARKALFKGMKTTAANINLVADRKAINEPVMQQLAPEHTVGADATAMGYKAGDTIKKSDRDSGSIVEQAQAGVSSTLSAISGGTSQAFDTTKYSEAEKHAIATTKATTQGVRDARDARVAERAKNPEVGDSLGTQVASSSVGRTLNAATGYRMNSYTKDEKDAIRDTKAKTFAIHGQAEKRRESPKRQSVGLWQGIKNFFSSLNPFGPRKLGDYKGFTPENQSRIDEHTKANADIDSRVKAESRTGLLGNRYTAAEKLERAGHDKAIEDITREQSTGYTAADREELANQRGKRADIKAVAGGGMTRAENDTIAEARKQRGQIKDYARDHAAFVSDHDGEQVRANGRVGGMDSSDEGAKLGEQSTIGGQVAQAVRTGGAALNRAGRILGGKSQDADEMIRQGDRSGAAMTTAAGISGHAGAAVATALIPGSGSVVKATHGGLSTGMKTAGSGLESLAAPFAKQQDSVDRHQELHSGERAAKVRTQGVEIYPTWHGQKDHSQSKELVEQAQRSLNSAPEPEEEHG
jgi:hypothetical protein